MRGQAVLDLGGGDDRVLVLAEQVLNSGGRANKSSRASAGPTVQERGNQLGGVARALGSFAHFMELLDGRRRPQPPRRLRQPPPGGQGQGWQRGAARLASQILDHGHVPGIHELGQQTVIAIAPKPIGQSPDRLGSLRFEIVEQGGKRRCVRVRALFFRDRLAESSRENIEIAHLAEQASQPFQLAVDLRASRLRSGHPVREARCAGGGSQRAGGGHPRFRKSSPRTLWIRSGRPPLAAPTRSPAQPGHPA